MIFNILWSWLICITTQNLNQLITYRSPPKRVHISVVLRPIKQTILWTPTLCFEGVGLQSGHMGWQVVKEISCMAISAIDGISLKCHMTGTPFWGHSGQIRVKGYTTLYYMLIEFDSLVYRDVWDVEKTLITIIYYWTIILLYCLLIRSESKGRNHLVQY